MRTLNRKRIDRGEKETLFPDVKEMKDSDVSTVLQMMIETINELEDRIEELELTRNKPKIEKQV